MNGKTCQSCGKLKLLRNFKYNKYFKSHHRSCKTCEALIKRQKKIATTIFVKKNKVTPRQHRKIQLESSQKAFANAKSYVFERTDELNLKYYNRAKSILNFYPVFCFATLVLTFLILDYSLHINFLISAIILTLMLVFKKRYETRYVKLIDERIKNRSNLEYDSIFDKKIQERLTYEKFYTSYEWKVVSKDFIRKSKNINGQYQCQYCGIYTSLITVDHHLPRSKYPELSLDKNNFRRACRTCNSRKGTKIINTKF